MIGNVTKTRLSGKPEELRLEMMIRNADSGKLMGVRGRRVAAVEQMTNTVISFQKVPPGQKERALTITGDTPSEVEHARVLIMQTIQRNMSPTRADNALIEESAESQPTDDA